jgi:hypothetical protein
LAWQPPDKGVAQSEPQTTGTISGGLCTLFSQLPALSQAGQKPTERSSCSQEKVFEENQSKYHFYFGRDTNTRKLVET